HSTTTDGLDEGSANKYYSTQLFAADLAGTTTDALAQGSTNLYFTTTTNDYWGSQRAGTSITWSSGFDLDATGNWTGTLDGWEGNLLFNVTSTQMASDDFGDFSCDGTDQGCTLDIITGGSNWQFLTVNAITPTSTAVGIIINASSTINHNLTVGTSTALYVDSGNGRVGIGTINPPELLTVEGVLAFGETTIPATTANYGKLYVKNTGSLYFLDESGTETLIAGQERSLFYAYDTTGDIDISAGWTDITLDTEVREDTAFTHSVDSAEITINTDGWYEITYHISTYITSGTGGNSWQATAIDNISTTSITYIPVNNMATTTTSAGDYYVWFSSSMEGSANNSRLYVSLFLDDTWIDHTEREIFLPNAITGTSL
ncbi:hypothetical protein LCGC14_2961480, partial [marine sediment metagenome]